MNAPQFTHDCTRCKFLGRSSDGAADLYVCENGGYATHIARYSSIGSDYHSRPNFPTLAPSNNAHLREAAELAVSP